MYLFSIILTFAFPIFILLCVRFLTLGKKLSQLELYSSLFMGISSIGVPIILGIIFPSILLDHTKLLTYSIWFTFLMFTIKVALIEEVSKSLAFVFNPMYQFSGDKFQSFFIALIPSFVFTIIENIIYINRFFHINESIGFKRAFLSTPLHLSCAIIISYSLFISHNKKNQPIYFLAGILMASFIHGLYNTFAVKNMDIEIVSFTIMFSSLAIYLVSRVRNYRLYKKFPQ